MENNLTEKSKDTITYCMIMFDDYITTCSGKFIFLLRMLIYLIYIYISFVCLLCHWLCNNITISCLYNFISTFVIRNVAITIYEHIDVDINLLQHSWCWYIFNMNIYENSIHHFVISNVAITLYEHVDVDIILLQYPCCWYIFIWNSLKIQCWRISIYIYINILFLEIVLYQHYDVDIIHLNNLICWYCFISTTFFIALLI